VQKRKNGSEKQVRFGYVSVFLSWKINDGFILKIEVYYITRIFEFSFIFFFFRSLSKNFHFISIFNTIKLLKKTYILGYVAVAAGFRVHVLHVENFMGVRFSVFSDNGMS
jgi:hypothetical protein